MTSPPLTRNNSASLRRGVSILLHLGGPDTPPSGATVTELGEALSINRSTVTRLVTPLCESGLLERDETTGRYRLGSRTAQLGQAYLDRLDIRTLARPALLDLVETSGETAYLVLADAPEVVYIDKVDSPRTVRLVAQVGSRQPMHSTAVGKSILAHAARETVAQVIASGLQRRTAHTHTTAADLRADLTSIAHRGYAVDDVENETGVRCVAAPVFDATGEPRAALSVSGPDTRLTMARVGELGDLVADAAADISRRWGAVR